MTGSRRRELPDIGNEVDEICDSFERAWQADAPPLLSEWLDNVVDPAIREKLLLELLRVDVEYRLLRGESPEALSTYVSGFGLKSGELSLLALKTQDDTQELNDTNEQFRNTLTGIEDTKFPFQFGEYEILSLVGRGGMGVVYLARQIRLDRIVAVKTLSLGTIGPAALKRFQSEAEAASRVVHPGVVTVHEYGDVDGIPYYSMDYVDGDTLHNLVTKATLSNRGHPRVVDFGLAKVLSEHGGLTQTGDILGTAAYMAPEQARGDSDIGPYTDVYAIGAVLYYCLTGRPAFHAMRAIEVLPQVIEDEPIDPRRVNPQASVDLETICLKCMRKSPSKRFQTAAVVKEELDRYLNGKPIRSRPISRAARAFMWARRRPWLCGTLTIFALMISTFLYMTWQYSLDLRKAVTSADIAKDREKVQKDLALKERTAARLGRYRSDLRLAFELREGNSRDRILRLLNDQIPVGSQLDFRGPEWFALHRQIMDAYTHIGNHPGGANECVVVAGENRAYTAGTDGRISVWDLSTLAQVEEFAPGIGAIHAMALSPDQTTLAIGGSADWQDIEGVVGSLFKGSFEPRGHVHLIDRKTGDKKQQFQDHSTTIESLAFSSDGKWLAAGARYEPVRVTRLSDAETFEASSPDGHNRNRQIAFFHDNHFLLVPTKSHFVAWNFRDESPHKDHEIDSFLFVPGVASACCDGEVFVLSNHTNFATVHNSRTEKPFRRLSLSRHFNDGNSISLIAVNEAANIIAVGTAAGLIATWRFRGTAPTGSNFDDLVIELPESTRQPHNSGIECLQVLNDGSIISTDEKGAIVLTDIAASGFRRQVIPDVQIIHSLLRNNRLWVCCSNGDILEMATDFCSNDNQNQPKLLRKFTVDNPTRMASTPLGDRIALGCTNGAVIEIDVQSRQQIVLGKSRTAIRGLAYSPSGRLLAWIDEVGELTLFDRNNKESRTLKLPADGICLKFANDGRSLVCGIESHESIVVLDTATLSASCAHISAAALAAFSASHENWLLTIHTDGRIRKLNTTTWELASVTRHKSYASTSVFSPNGRTIVSMGSNGDVRFTDRETGQPYGEIRIKIPGNFVPANVHFTPDRMIIPGWTHFDPKKRSDIFFLDLSAQTSAE